MRSLLAWLPAWSALWAALLLAGCASTPLPSPVPQPLPAAPAVVRKPAKIGLVLGGGAARGFAHIGVIQVLEEAGIRPSLVVGTSAGSLVAAFYASGKTGPQLQQVAESMEEATFADWTLPIFSRGMLRGEALARYVSAQVNGRLIEGMPLPLGIVATDLNSGEGVLFRRGDTATAVRASSAVPALFQPVRIAGREYVDGGLVSPVPVRYARQMGAEVIIAVDISDTPESNSASDTLQILLQTFSIMGKSINSFELRNADVVVRPSLLGVASSDFAARRRAIVAGRVAMQALLPQLRSAMQAHESEAKPGR
ncbi:MAG: patatin-like phospholipase family protein [Rhodoferax sp.]|uniref:patatin-like phospholipase family protein n=1 Tax=Rhodoferax sp. TaxID=50421 RepID=UPI00261B989F|nr:patatin-like phospholipase family protein [Rhodoferax sp.]MDD5336340.1 patatin-like phospholipase family protein [Rhodoferax sp.]